MTFPQEKVFPEKKMLVSKWGNSLAIRLSRSLVEALRELRIALPVGYRFDRDNANER